MALLIIDMTPNPSNQEVVTSNQSATQHFCAGESFGVIKDISFHKNMVMLFVCSA